MRLIEPLRWYAAIGGALLLAAVGTTQAQCIGDCSNDSHVAFDEIMVGVGLALGSTGLEACSAFGGNDGVVTVGDVVSSVNSALSACSADCGDCSDGNACTTERCDGGQCVHEQVTCADDGNECTAEICEPASGCHGRNVENGTLCASGTGYCQGGACSAFQCTVNSHCEDHNVCTTNKCINHSCVSTSVTCASDGNECSAEVCDPTSGCGSHNVQDGTVCNDGAGSCESGGCVAFPCITNTDCEDGNLCTTNACANNSCTSTAVVCQDDGNDCTAEACNPASGCGSHNVQDGTACSSGAGSCQSGVCSVTEVIQYQQNFETLDPTSSSALGSDKWVVYGNVFDATGKYKYGYGPYPAPNGGAAFSAIVVDQGGPEQGAQQLSIYDDYNNMDHSKGYRIESNVYRERKITADDVGTTIRFSFDAKRGNINEATDPLCPCTSTALAFIKTLNPAAGYATTNFIQQNATALPTTWGRYSLTIELNAGLVNQLLQVGFSTNATYFQPSAVFYDNIKVISVATTP